MATYMNEKPITKTLCIKVTDEMQDWLKATARHEQRSMGQIVRELLTNRMRIMPRHRRQKAQDDGPVK
jgi:predicted DNA-binding protein